MKDSRLIIPLRQQYLDQLNCVSCPKGCWSVTFRASRAASKVQACTPQWCHGSTLLHQWCQTSQDPFFSQYVLTNWWPSRQLTIHTNVWSIKLHREAPSDFDWHAIDDYWSVRVLLYSRDSVFLACILITNLSKERSGLSFAKTTGSYSSTPLNI